MKKSLLALALAVPLVASAQNLLTNGSFETVGLAGWTLAGGGVSPTIDIAYGTTTNTFGEAIIQDNAAGSSSPDAAGARAAYFVDDIVSQTLSQSFSVAAAGQYAVGFSYYFPKNGLGNPGNSTFGASVDANSLLSVSAAPPSQVWTAVSTQLNLSAGSHSFTFRFTPQGSLQSEDVVIDRVYVTAVPEPETFALMAAGLAGIGFMARRRRG